jgi:hypothetical protein
MTTIVYNHATKELAADTRMTGTPSTMATDKIAFPKTGVVLATVGAAGVGEWLAVKLKEMKSVKEIYDLKYRNEEKIEDFGAFLWWNGPYFLEEDLNPIPIKGVGWGGGTGGAFALANVNLGMNVRDAVGHACLLDTNSGMPCHVINLNLPKMKLNAKSIQVYTSFRQMHFPTYDPEIEKYEAK